MDSEKKELMINTYRRFMEIGLGDGDPDLLLQIADEKIVGFGTAIDEKILGVDQVKQLLQNQKAQSKGFELSWKTVPISHYTSDDELTAVFADELYLTIKAGEESIEMYLRFSVVMNYADGRWKVIHWHGSKPEQVESEKDTWGLDVWKQKAEELERLVDIKTADLVQKNRELEIETALEKVRTVAMGMKAPEDMLSICQTIALQLEGLGLDNIRNVQTAIFYPDRGTYMNYEYYSKHDKTLVTEVDYRNHPIQHSFADKMMTGPGEEVREHLSGQKMRDWHAFQKTTNQFVDDYILTAASLNYYWFSLGPVALGTSTYAPLSPQDIDLFKRFIKVFELAYQRYLDIEKAFSQAKEAQIEAALERVRSRSMAMHSSEELKEVISQLLDEIRKLEIPAEHAGFYIDYKQREDWHIWLADPNQIPFELTVPYFDCLVWHNYNNAKEQGLDAFAYTYSFEEKNDFYKKMFLLFPIPDDARTFYLNCPGLSVSTVLLDNVGLYVENFSGTPYTEEENRIVMRFGKVFQQTYTRFLDLQKAEDQARETQIQLGLERVRAKTMAMQNKHDLFDVVNTFGEQLVELGLKVDYVSFINGTISKDRDWDLWGCNPVLKLPAENNLIPYKKTAYFFKTADSVEKYQRTGNPIQVKSFTKAEKDEFFDHYFSHAAPVPDEFKQYLYDAPGSSIVDAFLGEVTVSLCRYDLESYTQEQLDIFNRFSKEFRQAYIRFLDLQKAEAQAREAQIEAALERVRAKAMAMHNSADLPATASTAFSELKKLGFTPIRTGISIQNRENRKNLLYSATSTDSGETLSLVGWAILDNHPVLREIYDKWLIGEDYFPELHGEMLKAYYEQVRSSFDVPVEQTEVDQYGYFMHFTFGLFYGWCKEPVTEEEKKLLRRFTSVIDLTFKRYFDLQKAESQAREAEIELALERVRARTMAMQHSAELAEASAVLDQQVRALGIETWGCAFHIYANDPEGDHEWFSSREGNLPFYKTPRESFFLDFYEKGKAGETFHLQEFLGEDCKKHYDYLMTLPTVGDSLRDILQSGGSLPASQYDHVAFFKYGYVLFITYEPAPDAVEIFKRFAKVFDQTYTRFLDLQKAEAQAREAQIEAALERVRARAMAMHASTELGEVVQELRKQMGILGQQDLETCVIHLHDESPEYIESWAGIKPPDMDGGILDTRSQVPKRGLIIIEEALAAYEANQQDYVISNEGDKLRQWFSFLEQSSPEGFARLSKSVNGQIEELKAYWSFADFKGGSLLMVTRDTPDEPSRQLLRRFSNVFGLAYRRFTDIKNAEARAREAQIEAALERVRSKTMAMHNSQDVGESVATLFEELVGLDVLHPEERCGIGIMLPNQQMEAWTAAKIADGKAELTIGLLDMTRHPLLASAYNGWVDKKEINQYILEGEDRRSYYEAMLKQPSYKITRDHYTGHIRIFHNDFYFKEGCLYVFAERDLPEASLSVYTRFAAVFGQTYRRYQDLLKAEAQAREAQVEAALEKVRSRTMAMQKPDELADTAHVLFDQLRDLGVTHERINIGIVEEVEGRIDFWLTEQGGNALNNRFSCRISEPTTIFKVYQAWKAGSKSLVVDLQGSELEQWIEFLHTEVHIPFEAPVKPVRRVHTAAMFSKGMLILSSPEPLAPEALYLLERFAGVFDLTYTRFNDLKTAEAQAREATKQASLDRVRAVIASMRSTEDLELITPLIFKELTILGVPFIRCGVFIIHEDRQIIDAYLSSPSGASLGVLHLPYEASELTLQTVESWRNGRVHHQHWNQEDFIAWTKQMMEQHQIESSRTYQGADTAPESLDLHFVPFDQGMFYVGSLQPLSDHDLELVLALAKSFSIAYARYEDFVKLEAAKANIESTLTELKSTQAQLIQQEKLASLGQLTAGIAHEIQNPLNFVNNFSEINAELSEEILEAIAKGDLEEARALATDIKSNQEKIREHGKRADSIVKGMLQHSRSSAGSKEPTDLAALADEYLRLSYHGMRAKDKSFNASIKTDFDPQLPLVPVVAQDIGRVLLNLFNNAFYAVNERKKMEGDRFEPEVLVQCGWADSPTANPPFAGLRNTQPPSRNVRDGSTIQITVRDNGTGIPESIKEKIFQPFFTTKPTGQGTGLGLSLSYDIVKAHGGAMKVHSNEGEGTAFIIHLPI